MKVPHNGVGKMETGYRFKYFDLNMVRPDAPYRDLMETGYRFKYFDLNMVRPDAPYRDFLALSRNVADERAAPESFESVIKQ